MATESTINVDDAIPAVRGSYERVLRIFKNLVENSLIHSRTDGLVITVKLLSLAPGTVSVLFDDNGIGVSGETKDAIANALQLRDVSAGLLGLKICKELMNGIRGNIEVANETQSCGYKLTFQVAN
jgi:signal transduction histidine kinase